MVSSIHAIEKIMNDTLTLLERAEDVPQMSDPSVKAYQAICRRMPQHIRSGRLKIAVVGVIKSGKSTLVNALVGKELVKRGAGVITSITTRIRKGKKNQADLYFKSWGDINAQLQKALVLFPEDDSDDTPGDIPGDIDIRRKKDRAYLKKVYQTLTCDFPVTTEGIRPETLLIRHALHGFEACKDLVQADETLVRFEAKEFDRHKTYTSDPDKAFYIKDVCLNVFGKLLDPNIEIADCQGADSTDPASLAQVLTYLESANLIVYCISSRTGLRQSDMVFLKQIKNSGLLDNIIFINNCDLTEHENLEDLIKIETSIRETLEFLEIQPRIFSVSSLYTLFLKLEPKLTPKDLTRLALWQTEKQMRQYCEAKTDEFNAFFHRAIDKNRYELLISNHLKRLGIIIGQVDRRADMFLDLLSSDKLKEETILEKLSRLDQTASRLNAIASNSITEAVSGLKDEIDLNIRKMFVQDEADILKKALAYIKTIDTDVEHYRSVVKESGVNRILYLMFQAFNRRLAVYGIEEVRPWLKKFVEAQEERITAYFQSLFESYQIDLLKIDPYLHGEAVSEMAQQQSDLMTVVDIDKLKKILGLQLPTLMVEARYTSGIKATVVTDFFLQTLSQILSSLFSRKAAFSFSPALEKAAVKLKKENQKVLKNQFEHYPAKLKTMYFLPLMDAATREFKERIEEQFNRYHAFKEESERFFSLKHSEKKDQKENLLSIKQQIQKIAADIVSYSKYLNGAIL